MQKKDHFFHKVSYVLAVLSSNQYRPVVGEAFSGRSLAPLGRVAQHKLDLDRLLRGS